jgi:hypothetical protein
VIRRFPVCVRCEEHSAFEKCAHCLHPFCDQCLVRHLRRLLSVFQTQEVSHASLHTPPPVKALA